MQIWSKDVSCSNLEKSVCFQYCYGSHWWLGTGVDQLDDGLSSGCLAWQYSVMFNRTCSTGTEYWLVVYLLLWKIWKSIGMMKFPIPNIYIIYIYGKIKNGPKHQPDVVLLQNMIFPSKKSALGKCPMTSGCLNISDSQTTLLLALNPEISCVPVASSTDLRQNENRATARGL